MATSYDEIMARLPEHERLAIKARADELRAKDHKARVRASAKKMAFIHRAALKILADGADLPEDTRRALAELATGNLIRYKDVDDMFRKLGIKVSQQGAR